ncbi:MAG TPA: preprotein translocase subunit SecG [Acidimicrobiales bacterium]|nr:preprotein translocase subunit SecG [Acidimicrobiales bacterium]
MITAVTTTLNVLASLLLIVLVLLHSGKGGGLSDMFGGGVGSSAMGSTVMERNLDRLTVAVALVWAFTVVALSLMLG